jgi:transposase
MVDSAVGLVVLTREQTDRSAGLSLLERVRVPPRPRPIRAWHLPEQAPVPTGQAAALEAQVDRHLVRHLGALPLLVPIVERLKLREVVNQRCHPRASMNADLDLGHVAEVVVFNRLLAPRPLVHVEAWVAGTVLPDLLGLDAAQCNDDRLARTLDALVPHLDGLWQDLIVGAVQAFDLDLSRLGYDLTSISFCGDYDEADLITFGYSRDHRPDRKQIELATTLTLDGGVPLDYRVLAGNTADRTTPVENLHRVQRLLAVLPPRRADDPPPLVISDRAMLTDEAIGAYAHAGLCFLGPLDPTVGDGAVRRLLASVSAAELAAAPLTYRPQRAASDPTWEAYHGVLRPLEIPLADQSPSPPRIQALVVWSPAKARLDAQLRTAHLERLERALQDLAGKVGRRPYTTRGTVDKRVVTLLRHHPARPFLDVRVGGGTAGEPLAVTWARREEAIATAAELDGRYVLGTNAALADPSQILALSKRRDVPEKRYALLKGPLAVRPVYLHKEERIRALVFCTMVALLIFALLELLARRALLPQSGTTLIEQFVALGLLTLVFRDASSLRWITGLAPPSVEILRALNFPPVERYVTVHP